MPDPTASLYEYFGTSGDLRLKQIKYINSSSAVLAQFDYTYSVEGDIESWAQKTGSLDKTWEFGYDLISQLTGNTVKESGNVVEQYDYVYDAGGNRLSTRKDSEVWSASYNVVNEMVSTSAGGKLRIKGHTDEPAKVKVNNVVAKTNADNEYEAVVDVQTGVNTIEVEAEDFSVNANKQTKQWEVTLSSPGAKTFTYDANGNLTGDGTHTYEWDAENRLVAINETATDQRTEMTYDGMNRWVKIVEKDDEGAVISTRQFVWDGLRIAERRDGSNNVVRQYFAQGFYDAVGSDAYLYTKDHLGSVRQLLDESEAVATEYKYDPYGKTTKVSGAVEGDFLYTGHYYHGGTGLYMAPFRAYDSKTGRWLSRDPIGEKGGVNLYGYVENNPTNLWDPFGFDHLEYYAPGSQGQAVADSVGKPTNAYNVGAHGPPNKALFYDENTGEWKDAKDMARDILSDPEYDPSKPIKLNICYAGKNGLAQDLANETNNEVIANTGTVNGPVTNVGFGNFGWGFYFGGGSWKTFKPVK